MKAIVIAGTHIGAGSTTVSLSVMDGLRKQGLRVQAFKFGPGFSENDLFEAATGRMAVNLDPWNVPRDCLLSCVHRYGAECDVAIVDGSGGLFDHRVEGDEWSTAELARFLSAPVILVVDAGPMRESCAALVKGFESFDKKVKVSGVVLNRVEGSEQGSHLAKTLDRFGVKAPCLGYLSKTDVIAAGSTFLDDLMRISLDLNVTRFIEIATTAKVPKRSEEEVPTAKDNTVKIAIAKDAAFSFYYHENFMLLERAGAELVFFSPLEDERLPKDISGIYLGGGHPELHAARLSSNTTLLTSIRAFASAGGVVYAEGGGLLYLSRSVEKLNELPPQDLVGFFPFRTRMSTNSTAVSEKTGHITVDMLTNCPVFEPGLQAKGHISHNSHIVQEIVHSAWRTTEENEKTDFDYAYRLSGAATAKNSAKEGYTRRSVLASHVHLQFASNSRLAPTFVEKCRNVNLTKVQEAMSRERIKASSLECVAKRPLIPKSLSMKDTDSTDDDQMNKKLTRDVFRRLKSFPAKPSHTETSAFTKGKEFKLPPVHVYTCEVHRTDSVPASVEKISAYIEPPKSKTPQLQKSFSLEDVGFRPTVDRSSGNRKIVGLSVTGVEMICALGLENRLVGVTNLCNYPEGIQTDRTIVARTKFEASHLDDSRVELKLKDYWCRQESAFDLEEDYLRAEQPSLVVVEDGGDPDKSTIEQIFKTRKGSFTGLCPPTPTTVLSHKCRHLNECLEFMLRIAEAAGVEDAAGVIVDKLRARVARIGTLVASDFPVEKVVVLTCLNPLMIGGYWIPEMVSLAGGEPLGAHPGRAPQRVTWLELKAMEPEVMILAAAPWEETKQELVQLASLPGWWGVPAMKTGQLYVCDHKLFSMAGPRLIDGVELLARILHPSSAGQYGKQGMAWSCTLRAGKRCRPGNLCRQFCALL